MHKILSFYNSNRRVIWIAILAIAFTIILLQTLNNDAKKRNSEINTNDEINSSSNTTIYPNNQEDFLSSNYNSEKIQDEKLKLTHELGHCCTGSFYNEYSACDIRQKCENRADRWAIKQLIAEEELDEAVANGHTEIWDLADYFDVTEEFMRKAVCLYTYGNLATELYF